MALIVETGEGIVGANSYIDVDWADNYFSARHNTEWAEMDTAGKETALIQSAEYLDTTYAFVGIKATSEQGLQWPRIYAMGSDGIYFDGVPGMIKKASAELALRALTGDLLQDSEFIGRVKRERVEGAVEIEYANDGAIQVAGYPYIDKLLMIAGLVRHKLGISGHMKIMRV